MRIAIVGTGNVGSALASKWAKAGHSIRLGVRDTSSFKGKKLLDNPNTTLHTIAQAVQESDVILLATPAMAAVDVAKALGNTGGKVIIDTMNIVGGRGPVGYSNTSDAILNNTDTEHVVKCFNTTGYNNMENPVYNEQSLDMFVCGDSAIGKEMATQLAKDAGFGACHDVGGNEKFQLMEQFALFWINLAMFRGMGREIGFKLLFR
jgi:predicted dinucleotide-binding enzyme